MKIIHQAINTFFKFDIEFLIPVTKHLTKTRRISFSSLFQMFPCTAMFSPRNLGRMSCYWEHAWRSLPWYERKQQENRKDWLFMMTFKGSQPMTCFCQPDHPLNSLPPSTAGGLRIECMSFKRKAHIPTVVESNWYFFRILHIFEIKVVTFFIKWEK